MVRVYENKKVSSSIAIPVASGFNKDFVGTSRSFAAASGKKWLNKSVIQNHFLEVLLSFCLLPGYWTFRVGYSIFCLFLASLDQNGNFFLLFFFSHNFERVRDVFVRARERGIWSCS